jgi:hypothetical protein
LAGHDFRGAKVLFSRIAVMSLFVFLCSCANSVEIKSVKSDTYKQTPHKVFFVVEDGFRGRLSAPLATKLSENLSGCGVETAFDDVNKVTLESRAQKIQKFSPDTIALIQWTSGRAERNGGIVNWNYDVQMQDIATKATFWKGQIVLLGGANNFLDPDGDSRTFSMMLINRLSADGILPGSCQIVSK